MDIASPEVIAHTDEAWQDYVRLYFRPRTPTQFSNEGFRPSQQQAYHAQCPVPVYLLFDAVGVLSKPGVLFTDGNLANGAQPTNDLDSFKSIPFEIVYHDTWFSASERAKIVYNRHAEVLAPERLSVSAIRYICCRSQAEYETLLELLPPRTQSQWEARILVRPGLNLFYGRWSFVEQVEMTKESVLFRFNVGDPPGPFRARAKLVESFNGNRHTCRNDEFIVPEAFRLRLNFQNPQDYVIKLWLDDQLAYYGRYQEEHLPF